MISTERSLEKEPLLSAYQLLAPSEKASVLTSVCLRSSGFQILVLDRCIDQRTDLQRHDSWVMAWETARCRKVPTKLELWRNTAASQVFVCPLCKFSWFRYPSVHPPDGGGSWLGLRAFLGYKRMQKELDYASHRAVIRCLLVFKWALQRRGGKKLGGPGAAHIKSNHAPGASPAQAEALQHSKTTAGLDPSWTGRAAKGWAAVQFPTHRRGHQHGATGREGQRAPGWVVSEALNGQVGQPIAMQGTGQGSAQPLRGQETVRPWAGIRLPHKVPPGTAAGACGRLCSGASKGRPQQRAAWDARDGWGPSAPEPQVQGASPRSSPQQQQGRLQLRTDASDWGRRSWRPANRPLYTHYVIVNV